MGQDQQAKDQTQVVARDLVKRVEVNLRRKRNNRKGSNVCLFMHGIF